ncbi:hypothetical protein D9619_005186 [Psilocybe cf. subviscida]|uniref:RING-type E3 ubiquitin transferase n=1 Tax=Psilocybe cf. subviscida TaxID=2480587 RepID=A0A8H5BWC8_9AGAR|nr:hypothetical protein D9619_005186 [Psilocybe cf. subviscida]
MSTTASTQTQNQTRIAEGPKANNRRANKGRGGPNNNRRGKGPSAPAQNAEYGGSGLAGSEGTENGPAPIAEGAEVVAGQLAAVALSDAGDADVCWICAEPVKYYAVPECNHRTCHTCALRLRALYKKLECTFCKEPQTTIIFTKSADKLYATFTPEEIPYKDTRLSISFETQDMMEDTLLLLRFNCPDSSCDYMGGGWGDLRLHVRATHGKLMCDLCIRHKKVFTHEHALYAPGQLAAHLPSTSGRPSKAALKDGVEGGVHPFCQFCRECYFGDDEIYAHMREKHEECFICKRNGVVHQYFQNYESLERHFNTDHYPCTQPDCLAQKFVVFNTPLDLKAHMVESHGGDMTARDKREARRIQAEFAFEEVGQGGRHGHGRGGGGRDRDRDRHREPPPPQPQASTSVAPPPPSAPTPAGGNRKAGFGGALTNPNTPGTSTPVNRGSTPPGQPSADVDPALLERHASFLARLQSLAPNPSSAVAAVKAATRGYRFSESSARDLILTVWNVLDNNLEHTASIINAFVDLLDEEDKKQDLLTSWKGFALEQRRQFPDLTPTSFGSGYAGITSGRVLNAKHATATRASHSQQVWNRVEQAASSSSATSAPMRYLTPLPAPQQQTQQEKFPALGGAGSGPSTTTAGPSRSSGGGTRSTPWSGSSAPPPTLRSQAAVVAASSSPAPGSLTRKGVAARNQPPPPKLSSALFPELPSAATTRVKPQVRGNVSLQNILGSTGPPAVAAWGSGHAGASGGGGGDGTPQDTVDASETPAVAQGGKGKKGKGKQKQTLFTLGAFPS